MSQNEPVNETPLKDMGQGLVANDQEYLTKEMENHEPIENDHQTVLIVSNFLDANPEFAEKYDYLVEWQATEDSSNHNFMAKFRLKPNYRQG